MKNVVSLYFLIVLLLGSQDVISQSTITGTHFVEIPSSISDPPVHDPLCHTTTIELIIPNSTDSLFEVTNVSVAYNMISSEFIGGFNMEDQRSKIYCQNTDTEESQWTFGVGSQAGDFFYSRDISIANGVYPGGTNLVFEIWPVRAYEDFFQGCDEQEVYAENWSITVTYSPVDLDTSGVAVGSDVPDPSASLDIQSQQKGFLPPRLTRVVMEYISLPAEGLTVFCLDCQPTGLYTYSAGKWHSNGSSSFFNIDDVVFQNSETYTEDFIFGRASLPDNSSVQDSLLFFDSDKAAFRGGTITNDVKSWQPDSLGVASFAYGENLYAPSFGEVAFGINNEPYTPMSATSFNASDRLFSVGYGNGLENNFFFPNQKRRNALTILKSGRIGIGISNPNRTLDMEGSFRIINSTFEMSVFGNNKRVLIESSEYNSLTGQSDGSSKLTLFNSGSNPTIELDARNGFDGSTISMYNFAGDKSIYIESASTNNKGKITTDIIEIKGGSDFAEYFDVKKGENEDCTPGMIVSINPDSNGGLMLSDQDYDKKIIGVISGANGVEPGMIMGQEGTKAFGSHPISIIGRAYVKCNDENGMIEPGDFITSSSRVGQGMRVVDFGKAQGAILGKALTKVDPETGYVLVLINIQ